MIAVLSIIVATAQTSSDDRPLEQQIYKKLLNTYNYGVFDYITFDLQPDGSFTYTPDSSYTGTDTFTYRAFDSQEQSNLATVTFTVIPPK